MTDTLAYQIGAVFFLAVLFMAGTMTRGLFPTRIFDNVKLTLFVVAALLVGFAVYHGLPGLSSLLDFLPASTAQTPSTVAPAASAVKQTGAPRRATGAPRPAITVREFHDAPEPQTNPTPMANPAPPTEEPPPASNQSWRATPVQESGNRVTRAMESVGHFLHIGHAKYQPAPVAPQPATPTDQEKTQSAQ
jgi:hypothetical protein